jgi:hypothetical protein
LVKFSEAKDQEAHYFMERASTVGATSMHVVLRRGAVHLSRIQSIRPSKGELFYLRALLQARASNSFSDVRTVNNIEYPTFQDAAIQLGLFADTNEAMYAMLEAVQTLRTPRQLRVLLVHLLVNDCVTTPMVMWETFHAELAYDFTLRNENVLEIGINLALEEMAALLEEYGRKLSDFGLPEPVIHTPEVIHELARWGSNRELLAERADRAVEILKPEQRAIYDHALNAILHNLPLCLFVDGKAGRGKTMLVNTLCDRVRALGRIVIPTATAAFAAQLYPGGRTTHSAFKVHFSSSMLPLIT